MKVLVCGDRNWTDRRLIFSTLDRLLEQYKPDDWETPFTVIEGQARGADKIAGEWAEDRKRLGVVHDPHPAQWDRYGRGAGPKRNGEMLNEDPDLVVAFHPYLMDSRGTKDMVKKALAAKKMVWLLDGLDENMQKVRNVAALDELRQKSASQG